MSDCPPEIRKFCQFIDDALAFYEKYRDGYVKNTRDYPTKGLTQLAAFVSAISTVFFVHFFIVVGLLYASYIIFRSIFERYQPLPSYHVFEPNAFNEFPEKAKETHTNENPN
ncbi:MAG: hypothetical protein MHMPM18_001902 [Marteilia pararefringens]